MWLFGSKDYQFYEIENDEFNFIKDVEKNDSNFNSVSIDFVNEVILNYVARNQKFNYSKKFDCNRFADEFKKLSYEKALVDYDICLAVGLVRYVKDNEGLHMINCIITFNDGLIYVEPQNNEIIELSEKEIRSIRYHRF